MITTSLAIVCPSNNPDAFFTLLGPSLFPVAELVLVAQPPWTDALIAEAKSLAHARGVRVVRIVRCDAEEDPPRMAHLRLSGLGVSQSPFGMLVDDNLAFSEKGTAPAPYSSERRAAHAVQYLVDNPDCQVLLQTSCFGGNGKGAGITPYIGGVFATDRGMLIRHRPRRHFEERGVHLQRGGLEESLIAFTLLEDSSAHYAAKAFNLGTYHRPATGRVMPRGDALAHIRERYGDEGWTPESHRLPRKLRQRRQP